MASSVITTTGRPFSAREPAASLSRGGRSPIARAARILAIFAILVVFLAPYAWIVSSSFKTQTQIFANVSPISVWTFVPRAPILGNYTAAISTEHIPRAMLNSLIVAIGQLACTFLLTIPAAYGLTRLRFRGQTAIFTILLLTFMVPSEAIIVPLFQIVSRIGLADSLPGIFLPWVASPFVLFLLRQAFLDIPRSLDEAAKIDGAGHLRILFSVILPNVKPALAAASLVLFLFSWNAFLWPLIITESQSNQVIQVAIALNAVPGQLPNWGMVFAGAVLATLPVLILFSFLQRYFMRGIVMTGLK